MAKKKVDKMERVMKEYKMGELHSGSKHGPMVGSRKQAIAIAMSEARKEGESVAPPKKSSAARRIAIMRKRKG